MAWDDQTDGGSIFTAYLFELLRPGDRMAGAWLRAGNRLKLAAFTDAVTPNREAPVGETVYAAPGRPVDAGPRGPRRCRVAVARPAAWT